MNKLESKNCSNTKGVLIENIEIVNLLESDKSSFLEYLQYMVGLAKIRDPKEVINMFESSMGVNSIYDTYFISSFLWHCNLKGKGKSIPISERKALSSRFEKIIIKTENRSLNSSDAQKELRTLKGTVNCMLYYCSNQT